LRIFFENGAKLAVSMFFARSWLRKSKAVALLPTRKWGGGAKVRQAVREQGDSSIGVESVEMPNSAARLALCLQDERSPH
jgi:hypothetical protein